MKSTGNKNNHMKNVQIIKLLHTFQQY